jgi:hypothetical protein
MVPWIPSSESAASFIGKSTTFRRSFMRHLGAIMGRLKDRLQLPDRLAELQARVDCRHELRQIEGIEAHGGPSFE